MWRAEFERQFRDCLAARRDLPRIETHLEQASGDDRASLLLELLLAERDLLREAGRPWDLNEYHRRFPEDRALVEELAGTEVFTPPQTTIPGDGVVPRAPAVPGTSLDFPPDPPTLPSSPRRPAESNERPIPRTIGRFEVERELGIGGFAIVWLARDPLLDRRVALKVPRPDRLTDTSAREVFLNEARQAAQLEHPAILRVHDVQIEHDQIYIALQYIDGVDLKKHVERTPPHPRQAVEWMVTIAEAVGHAHTHKLVHRDLKPANILVDRTGRLYVADFGLSLHRSNRWRHAGQRAGSAPYMSPEQVRGETHKIDGRSDLWSLGVILYELLTGSRPFGDGSNLDQEIQEHEPTPPRMLNPRVPAELSRICLKLLEKRSADRYDSATALVDDLRYWLDQTSPGEPARPGQPAASSAAPQSHTAAGSPAPGPLASASAATNPATATSTGPGSAVFSSDGPVSSSPASSGSPPIVVPRGLRSYEADDADFFLQLLPGVRGRDGLPRKVSFWKTRLEQRDPDQTFPVGVMYGPSGCGKSSLVKAALLPRLSSSVLPIYIEATPHDTEGRLLKALSRSCPDLAGEDSLVEWIAQLRERKGWRGRKVVLIIDQFEQWLHERPNLVRTQLALALRHCDGVGVQALLLVREDFWMMVTRFMEALEVPLDSANMESVDLFDIDHARKVLALFGRAHGRLPAEPEKPSPEQQEFLTRAVRELADGETVACVRLAVFAEMFKGRPWTPAKLDEVAQQGGVGVAFLEETFSAKTAPPAHRLHKAGAQRVLRALLPEVGSDIKGQMRSYQQLREAATDGKRPADFDTLLRILDREARLITPTEPEPPTDSAPFHVSTTTADTTGNPSPAAQATADSGRYFQLTHDYLVPALREWLTREQRETPRGRAELLLAERTALWQSKPEDRHLPTLAEHLRIRRLTSPHNRKEPERQMLRRAAVVHGWKLAWSLLGCFLLIGAGLRLHAAQRENTLKGQARELVKQLTTTTPNQWNDLLKRINEPEIRGHALPVLDGALDSAIDNGKSTALTRLALLQVGQDMQQLEPLRDELLQGPLLEFPSLRKELVPQAGPLSSALWPILRDLSADKNHRLRAAMALAGFQPADEFAPVEPNQPLPTAWTSEDAAEVATLLLESNPVFQGDIREALRPISGLLLDPLEQQFGREDVPSAILVAATNAMVDYASQDSPRLARLLTVATPEQFNAIYPLFEKQASAALKEKLARQAATLPPAADMPPASRITFGQHRANAAVTLLRLGELAPALKVCDLDTDPEALSQFLVRNRPRGVPVETLLDCVDLVEAAPADQYDARVRYALLLALGEYPLQDVPEARQEPLLAKLVEWYNQHPSSAVHGASGWLIRHWGRGAWLDAIEQTEVPYQSDREWFRMVVEVQPTVNPKATGAEGVTPPPRKKFSYTFVVFPAGEYDIGSKLDDAGAEAGEKDQFRHRVRITRPFAVLDREITMDELMAYQPSKFGAMRQVQVKRSTAGFAATWYEAVGFCRWLEEQAQLPGSAQAYPSPESLDPREYPRDPDVASVPRDWPIDLRQPGFRLPTESEWETAARSQMTTLYGFGNDPRLLDWFGWYKVNSDRRSHAPQELRPTLRGLFDVYGNMFEWTHDWHAAYESGLLIDPVGPRNATEHVARGGSWLDDAVVCRPAYRSWSAPNFWNVDLGFRIVRTIVPPTP